jgi:hypothetical protein
MQVLSYRIPPLAAVLLSAVIACIGQSELPEFDHPAYKGKIKTIALVREYLIIAGKAVPQKQISINQKEFNPEGKVVRHSVYGDIERRTTHSYRNGERLAETRYFDQKGREITAAGDSLFRARADIPLESDLCPDYTTRTLPDKQGGLERKVETCSSGSPRATEITEKNTDDTYERSVREDAKGRSWEEVVVIDAKGNPLEYRYIVNNLILPKYSWNISYVNHRSDAIGNVIEATASAIHSFRPNQVWYQYVERFEIAYF